MVYNLFSGIAMQPPARAIVQGERKICARMSGLLIYCYPFVHISDHSSTRSRTIGTTHPGVVHVFLRLVHKDILSDLEDLIDEDRFYSFDSLQGDICEDFNEVITGNGYVHGDKKFQVIMEQLSNYTYATLKDLLCSGEIGASREVKDIGNVKCYQFDFDDNYDSSDL